MDFADYVASVLSEVDQIRKSVQKRVPAGENIYARELEELFEWAVPALRLLEEAQEWHYMAVERILSGYPAGGNPKTRLDAAKGTPCPELTFLRAIQSLNKTIEVKTGQAQSIIKSYAK
jgi:hypothetical protein